MIREGWRTGLQRHGNILLLGISYVKLVNCSGKKYNQMFVYSTPCSSSVSSNSYPSFKFSLKHCFCTEPLPQFKLFWISPILTSQKAHCLLYVPWACDSVPACTFLFGRCVCFLMAKCYLLKTVALTSGRDT